MSPPIHALFDGTHAGGTYEFIVLEVSGTNNRLAFEDVAGDVVHYQRVKQNMSGSLVHRFMICRTGASC